MKRRVIVMFLAVLLLVPCMIVAAAGTPEAAAASTAAVQIAAQKIEPLPQMVELTFSTVGASVHALPLWIASEKGWLEKLNIKLKHISFDNGPIQMEALGANSWDFGTTGQGGVFTGVLQYDTLVLADLVSDDDTMRVWVRADHPIAKAGPNPKHPGIYGTAEQWKGLEIMTPQGTIAHFVVVKTLEALGLKESDVKIANMSHANAYTALTAGQGTAASLMGTFSYRLEADAVYKEVGSSNAVGGGLAIAMAVVNPTVVGNKTKMDAVLKAMDVHFAVVDWIKTITKAELTDWQVQMSEEKGLSSNYDELFRYMNGTVIYDFAHAYKLQTTVSDDGKLTLVEREIVDPLKFFAALGKYKGEHVTKMAGGFFPKEYMEKIKAMRE